MDFVDALRDGRWSFAALMAALPSECTAPLAAVAVEAACQALQTDLAADWAVLQACCTIAC